MSVVAVKVLQDKIVISADSQVSSWDNKIIDKERGLHEAKIYRVNEIIFGTAGYTDIASLFRLYCETRSPEHNTELGILNFLSDFTSWAKQKNAEFKLENHFIILFAGKCYVTREWEVSEVDTYTAIGSGKFLALGALYMGGSTERAIEVAKRYDLFCGGETITYEMQKEV